MDKFDQLLKISNEIRQDILDRRKIIDWDDWGMRRMEEQFLECLSTHLPDERRIEYIKKELKKFDKEYDNTRKIHALPS
jgi:hypothetical protein